MSKIELEQEKKELYNRIREINQQIEQLEREELAAAYGEKYGCEFCRFNAVQGLSGDSWHNTCGANNCTCCHNGCEKYKPDNEITLFIKQNINAGSGLLRCKRTNGYGHISEEDCRALDELGIKIFRIEDSLRSGHTQSCGCLSVKTITQRSYDNDYAKIHGLATSRIYKNYYAMRARCYNTKNQNYPRYGGKGIRVCDEWLNSFEAFYKWAMANGYDDTKTIDRINPDGDYTPDNCRFADASVQGFNRHTQSNNKTGHKGVCKANNGKYRAYIKKNGKQISLGSYETLDAAVQAREKAENELYKTEVV